MANPIGNYVRVRFRRWLDRRLPMMRSVTLDQRRIFIFPSRPGLWFMLLLLLLLIAAINYQNNMAFALVFLLASVFIVSILHTFANLSGLTISAQRAIPVFAGDNASFELLVAGRPGQAYFDVNLNWAGSEVCSVSLFDRNEQAVNLHMMMLRRGRFRPERLLVETFYPVGLLRAWTWLALDFEVLVYPRPQKSPLVHQATAEDKDEGDIIPVAGSDDFYELAEYKAGDSLKHVFWKGYAKDQSLQTKHYVAYREQQRWLDWRQFSGNTEQRLSKLCYWVLQLEKSHDDYGLRLPGVTIAPAHGSQHQTRLLTELALFQIDETST